MRGVQLSGHLVCRDEDEVRLVAEHLPAHVALTRAEPGCVSFEVTQTADLRVWLVRERFENEEAFAAHQQRARTSEWGRLTAGIERRYSIAGLTEDGRETGDGARRATSTASSPAACGPVEAACHP